MRKPAAEAPPTPGVGLGVGNRPYQGPPPPGNIPSGGFIGGVALTVLLLTGPALPELQQPAQAVHNLLVVASP